MNVIEHMENKKKEVDNLFHDFFTLHKQEKQEQHANKTDVEVPSINFKDLIQVAKPNLPNLIPKEELSKKLQRNDL